MMIWSVWKKKNWSLFFSLSLSLNLHHFVVDIVLFYSFLNNLMKSMLITIIISAAFFFFTLKLCLFLWTLNDDDDDLKANQPTIIIIIKPVNLKQWREIIIFSSFNMFGLLFSCYLCIIQSIAVYPRRATWNMKSRKKTWFYLVFCLLTNTHVKDLNNDRNKLNSNNNKKKKILSWWRWSSDKFYYVDVWPGLVWCVTYVNLLKGSFTLFQTKKMLFFFLKRFSSFSSFF